MSTESLRSIDLHLNYPPGEVVEVEKLIDVAAGMYPCYYTQTRDSVLVSTSVIKLIDNLGVFKKDPEFQPPEYLRDTAVLENYRKFVPNSVENAIGFVGPFLRQLGLLSSSRWDAQANTIDKRISRLQPFEIVTASNIQQEFTPTYSLDDKKEFVHRSAEYITNFVNEVEKQYPDYEHVIRMGGKDSQLISLVPKISDNWSIFSADPNYEIVEEFVERNNIKVNNIFITIMKILSPENNLFAK